MVPIIKHLKSKHNDIYAKYDLGYTPIFNLLTPRSAKINFDLIFSSKLNLDKKLNKDIRQYRLISYLQLASLLLLGIILIAQYF